MYNKEYNVGDKVKIRKDLESHKHYGPKDIYCTETMELLRGEMRTIRRKAKVGDYFYYELNGNCYTWCSEMFESNFKSCPNGIEPII